MPRQFSGRDQNTIETHIANGRHRIGGEPNFRRRRDALLLPVGDGFGRIVQCRARFHLDENQRVAAGGDDVDFAKRAFPAPRQNTVAMRDQPGRCAAFRRNAEAEAAIFSGRASRLCLSALGAGRLLRAIVAVFFDVERALIDFAARPPGGKRHFADRILDRDARQRASQ